MRILHMFQWNIKDIIKEIRQVKESGFDCIQISPIQPSKDEESPEWWMCYQPIGFRIGNRYGTKEDLKKLCKEANRFGIKIIVDVILNHMASKDNGDIYPHEKVDNILITNKYFWKTFNKINDWNNRKEVITNSMGLPSLRLDNYELQDIIIEFLKEIIDCGVKGLRFDSGKTIALPCEGSDFWIRVTKAINDYNNSNNLFNYVEVIFSEKYIIDEYAKYLNVITSSLCSDKNKIVTYVENHDTYLEFGFTKNITNDLMIKEYESLVKTFKHTLFYIRPYNDLWKSEEIKRINTNSI